MKISKFMMAVTISTSLLSISHVAEARGTFGWIFGHHGGCQKNMVCGNAR